MTKLALFSCRFAVVTGHRYRCRELDPLAKREPSLFAPRAQTGGHARGLLQTPRWWCWRIGELMHKFRRTALAAGIAVLVCMGVAAMHLWQAHGSGIAGARHRVHSLPIAD
jgi:hypothetical protein